MKLKTIVNLSVIVLMGISVMVIALSAYLSYFRHTNSSLHINTGVVFTMLLFFHIYLRKNRLKKEVASLYYLFKFR